MKRFILPFLSLLILALPALVLAQTYTYEGTIPPEEAAAWGIGCLIVSLVVGLAWTVVWIILMVWVYKDAKARGMENPAVWLILIIFTHIIGFIIYLVVRPKEKLPEGGEGPPPTA